MGNQNRQRGVLHEGKESRVLLGTGDPNARINADKGSLFIQTDVVPKKVWVNNNDQRGWEDFLLGACDLECACMEDRSEFTDDFHSAVSGLSFPIGPGLRGFISDHAWEVPDQDAAAGVTVLDHANGWVQIRGIASIAPVTSYLRTLGETFSPVALPGKPLKLSARVYARVVQQVS